MTSPGPDDFTRRLATAATATGNRPQLAVTLANSDLSTPEIQAVGGFVGALGLSVSRQLAANSGAKLNLTAQEKNQLAGIGENVPEDTSPDSRSIFEKATDWLAGAASNTLGAIVHNPLSDAVFTGMNFLGNAAHMPFRLLSDGLDSQNNDEIDQQMKAQGYDPTSTTSYLAFMFEHGESQYHDLSAVRDHYGDDLVDLAMQVQADPEQFQKDYEKLTPDEAAAMKAKLESQDFKDAAEAVDRKHISPGRDIARILTLGHTNNAVFTALSGTLDAAYDWFTDPTLILGKASKIVHAADVLGRDASKLEQILTKPKFLANRRSGLLSGENSMIDNAGIDALLRVDPVTEAPVTKVGKAWDRFLLDAKDHREAAAAGEDDKAAGIYRAMESRYGSTMMNFLPDINGQRVITDAEGGHKLSLDGMTNAHLTTDAKPIETLGQLAEHLKSTNGLLRFSNGMAAREAVVMPGRLSFWAENKAAADTRKARSTEKWINYADKDGKFIPNEAEQQLLDEAGDPELVRAGLAQAALLRQTGLRLVLGNARVARAKVERVARRFTTQIPDIERLDLRDPSSVKTIENIARMYLNRGDAAKLASTYVLSDELAARRAIARGVLVQAFHASGASRSEAGRNFMERFIGDQSVLEKQQYGYGKTSEMLTDRGNVQVAMYPDQQSSTVILPSMRSLNYIAMKAAVGGFAGRAGWAHTLGMTQSDGMDALIGRIKLGWITSAAGGLRNALDEVANFAAYGIGTDVLAGRVAFTRATQKLRADRLAASVERRALIATYGRTAADDRIVQRLDEGLTSHEDAALKLEQAQRNEAAVADVADKLKQRVTDAHVGRAEAFTYRYRALSEFEDAKKAGLPEEQLAPLRDRAQYWSDQAAKADDKIKTHEKAYANRAAKQDEVRQGFIDKGHLTVDEATRKLAGAKEELRQTQLLQHAISHRIPYAFRWAADNVNDLFIGAALGKALSVFGKDWAITGDRVKWAQELVDREAGVTFRDGVYQAHHADTELAWASDATASDYHRAGLMARKYSFRSAGWGQIETDGGAGLNAWAKTLQLRFADPNSPAHAWAQTVQSMWKPGMTHDEVAEVLDAARESVLKRLEDPELRHFVNSGEIFQWYKGTKIAKDDGVTKQFAKEEYADRVSLDLAQALGPEGRPNKALLDELVAGRVPDRSWLANNIAKGDRPSHAIGQLWAPYNPAMTPGQITRGMTGMMTKAYSKVVTDQINALSRNPLVTALYMRARENTQGYVKHLITEGWDPQVADDIGRKIAAQHAEVEAFKHIDNPYVSSQFSMLSRNHFAFVRAQEDWLKRWGRTVKDNPELIRKAQLLIHGGESTGFLEQDDQGQLHFVYPGSNLLLGLFGSLFGMVNKPNGARIPTQGELSSQLLYLNPSLDNPVSLSGTPLLSLPWKAIAHFTGPSHSLMTSSMDAIINGQLGAGRQWWEQLLPSWANRIIGGVLPTEDMNSKYGAAAMSTLANMEAAGMFTDAESQSPEGKARILHSLQVGIHNDLLTTALFGFMAPAAPTYEGGTHITPAKGFQGNSADWSAHIEGIRNLSDEARRIYSRLPFDEARQWWMKVHPNESVLAPGGGGSRTTVGADKAYAAATIAAASHIEHNADFYGTGPHGYGGEGGVAAYFIPQGKAGTKNGEFSDVAYRAQLELGVRSYKTLSDYFDDIVTSRGYAEYFATKDAYDAAKARAGNSPTLNAQVDAQWAIDKANIEAANPLLAQKLAASAQDTAALGNTMQSLYRMANDTSKSTVKALGVNRPGLLGMLTAKQQFDQGIAALGDRRGGAANRQRTQLKTAYDAQINQLAAQFPGLADLARGVFRPTS